MVDQKRTSREIEREVEKERDELQGTVEELFNRFTFEDAWNRVGAYMRANRGEFGQSFGRVVKEKPLAVALTAVGVGWLLFGPSQQSARPLESDRRTRSLRYGRDDHEKTREKLEEAEFAARSARGPAGAEAQTDSWEAPGRTTAEAARNAFGEGDAASGTKPPSGPAAPRLTDRPGATGSSSIPTSSAMSGEPRGSATTVPPVSSATSATEAGRKGDEAAPASESGYDEQGTQIPEKNEGPGKQMP